MAELKALRLAKEAKEAQQVKEAPPAKAKARKG
jgi:hypothetical protein